MNDSPSDTSPGDGGGEVLGRYRVLDELGMGGMGVVHLAETLPDAGEGETEGEPPAPGTRVALKILHPHLVTTKDHGRRFRREGRIGSTVVHPNLVRTYEAGTGSYRGTVTNYIAMELVEGQTLRDLVRELGRVPEELALTVASQVAAALEAVHGAGITHRDLKPENVIITPGHEVKVMDLGIAKVRDASIQLSLTGEFLGTIHYAAPEQFQSPEKVGPGADLYAMGVLLHEMLTGTNPFFHADFRITLRRTLYETPARMSAALPEVSAVLDQLVATLLAKSPDLRLPSATAVRDVLEHGEGSAWWQTAGRASQGAAARRRRLEVPRETRVVGRDEEIGVLRGLFERAARGSLEVVFVEGEAGVGKTRLLDESSARLEKDAVPFGFAFGNARRPGVGRPLHAFTEALLSVLDPGDVHGSLAKLLPESARVEAFAGFLTGAPGGPEDLSLDRVRTLFAACFRSLARERPLLVVLDDMHLADENSVNLLAYLARDVRDAPVLVAASGRPTEEGQPLHELAHGARDEQFHLLEVPRLAPRAVGHLLREALQNESLVQELGFELLEKTEGNPYFLFEVLRTLKQDQLIRLRPDGGWTVGGAKLSIHVPDSVKELLEGTLARLSEEDRDLLELAAVQGIEFEPDLLAHLLDAPKIPLLKRLSHLERRHRLIRSAGRTCRFDHHQLQETLYQRMMPSLREEYHALIGEALEERRGTAAKEPGDIPGPVALEVCHHLALGGRAAAAGRYAAEALEHAVRTYRTLEGLVIANALLAAAEVEPGALPPATRARVLLARAALHQHEGTRGEQARSLEDAVALLEQIDDPPLERRILDARIAMQFQLGSFGEAVATCREALRIASRRKDYDGAVAALGNLAGALRAVGRYSAAASAARRALSWVMHTPSTYRRSVLLTTLGMVAFNRGAERAAQRLFLQALELAREFKIPRIATVKSGRAALDDTARQEYAGLSRALGRYAESRIDGERLLLLDTGMPRRIKEAASLLALGVLAGHLDRLTDARALLQGALDACREEGDQRFESAVLHALGENAVQARDPDLARQRFMESLELRRKIGYRPGVCETLLALGQLAALGGAVEAARSYLDEAMEVAPHLEMPGIAALSRATAALLYAREGRPDLARGELEQAQSALGAGPLTVSSRAEGLYFAALAARALGDEEAYDTYMWRAYDLIQEVAQGMSADERTAFLTATSPNREIVAAVAG